MYPDGLQSPPTEKLGIPNKCVKSNGLISPNKKNKTTKTIGLMGRDPGN